MSVNQLFFAGIIGLFTSTLFAEIVNTPSKVTDTVQQELYLDVVLNQAKQEKIGHFLQIGQQLYIDVASLNDFSVDLVEKPVFIEQTAYVNLNEIMGLSYQYDDLNQKIVMQVPVDRLKGRGQYGYKRPAIAEINPEQMKVGSILNYSIFTQYNEDIFTANGWNELRVFGLFNGLFSISGNYQYNEHESIKGKVLDTYWEKDFPNKLIRVRLGDTQSSALPWTRSTRLSGLSLSKNFALQPYNTITPLMSFKGQVALPSQVDLIINGIKQFSQDVAPGQFDIQTAPSITGAGNAQMVITDINGQQQTVNLSLYQGKNLIAEGLHDWSINLGYLKLNYGLTSFDYGDDLAFSGNYRYGLSNKMTLQAHAELTHGLEQAGLGSIYQLGYQAGVVNISYAYSHANTQNGHLLGLGYNWNSSIFSLSYNALRQFGQFNDIASLNGTGFAKKSDQIYLGISTKIGQLGGSYLQQKYEEQEDNEYLLFNWSYVLPKRINLGFSYSHNLINKDNGYYLSLNIPWVNRNSATTSIQRSNAVNQFSINVLHAVDQDQGGLGVQLTANKTDQYSLLQSQFDYLSSFGLTQLNVQHMQSDQQNRTNAYASFNGGLVVLKDTILPTRLSNGAFAVVSTNHVPNVPVQLENRLIGETNNRGYLLLNNLNPYQHNSVTISALNLPLDLKIEMTQQDVVPYQASGAFVVFPIYKVKSVQFQAVDQEEKVLAVGSNVWDSIPDIQQKIEPKTIVAYEGLVYLDDLKSNIIYIGDSKKYCKVSLSDIAHLNGFTDLGRIVCQ